MPITVTCPNCAKSYQAPDSMAGKSVRCKACTTVFRIQAPAIDEPGDLDFDALESSFADEAVDTASGRPIVDGKGKVSIPRSANTADVAIAGDGSAAFRSNFRYRFPFAKQVDLFLPWVLVIACPALLLQWCMNVEAPGKLPETPETGVALSRFFLLLAAYVILIFPAAHLGMHKASRKLRFSMPRAAAWRTFAGFLPLLLLGAGLYILSGGAVFGLILGFLVGLLVSVAIVALLYRLFPNELPAVGTYTAASTVIAGAFAAAALFAINLVALSIANMSKKEPTSFVSPIAVGLRWQEPPPPTLAIAPKPRLPEPEATPSTQEASASSTLMPSVEVPRDPTSNRPQMVRRVERPPVTPAFEVVLTPPIESTLLAVVRDDAGGVIECFRADTWQRGNVGQGFERHQGEIAPNTTGDVAMRIVRVPSYRLEGIQLGSARPPRPIAFESGAVRTLFGFIDEKTLLVLVRNGAKLSLERFDIAAGTRSGPQVPFGNDGAEPLDVGDTGSCVRMTPDGTHILIAGRLTGGAENPGRLALYRTSDVSKPVSTRDLPLDARFHFQPIGLAINNDARVAMLLDTENEAYFTMWEMDRVIENVLATTSNRVLIDRKLGMISSLRPGNWEGWNYDALLWINDRSLLLFGTHIIDANTGDIIGNTGLNDIVGQVREAENVVALIQRAPNSLTQLLRVSFDPAMIDLSRRR